MGNYLGHFNNKKSVESYFSIELDSNKKIIFAEYDMGNYEGSAWVVFSSKGKLYEVHASHCSCNSLEGQWSPEETSIDNLLERMNRGGQSGFATHILKDALTELKSQRFDFDLESLPPMQDLKSILNIERMLQDGTLLSDQAIQIKSIQNQLVASIKEAILEEKPAFIVSSSLELSPEAQTVFAYQPKVIKEHVENLFKSTEETLKNKGYPVKIEINNDITEMTSQFKLENNLADTPKKPSRRV